MLNNKTYTRCMSLSQNGLHFIYILLVFGMLSLLQPAFAAVILTDGADQNLPAGSGSADIVFSVVDELGNPLTVSFIDDELGNPVTVIHQVNFSLINPANDLMEDGLTVLTAKPDDNNGQVVTHFKSSGELGRYTIIATLEADPTQFAIANLLVITGAPANLTVVEGGEQAIKIEENSADIVFELTDTFGNVISSERAINFTVTVPFSEASNTGIFPIDDVSGIDGRVTTRLEPVTVKGDYLVTAKLAADDTVKSSTVINVTEPEPIEPELPILGRGIGIDANGASSSTQTTFIGGVSVNDGDFVSIATIKPTDNISIIGKINVTNVDVDKPADILVVGSYTAIGANVSDFYMIDSNRNALPWDVNIASLVALSQAGSLPEIQSVELYTGPLSLSPGTLSAFFGYRLSNGVIIYNGDTPIIITITE